MLLVVSGRAHVVDIRRGRVCVSVGPFARWRWADEWGCKLELVRPKAPAVTVVTRSLSFEESRSALFDIDPTEDGSDPLDVAENLPELLRWKRQALVWAGWTVVAPSGRLVQ